MAGNAFKASGSAARAAARLGRRATGGQGEQAGIDTRFDRKLLVRVTLAVLGTLILAVMVIIPTYREYDRANDNLVDIRDYRQILDTATYISAERGPANTVMAQGAAPDSTGSKRLAEFRARSDASISTLASIPPDTFGEHHHRVRNDMLESVRLQLAAARLSVDRMGALPRDQVKLEEFDAAIEAMFEASTRFQAVVAWRASELVRHNSSMAAAVLVAQMLSEMREYGGRMGSHIVSAIAMNEKLPLASVISARQSQGRLLELWQIIRSQSTLYDEAVLADNRTAVDELYIGQGLKLLDRLMLEGRDKAHYGLTATEFTDRYVPTMAPIEAYRSAFLDAAVAQFEQARAQALATLLAVLATASAVLVILVGLILSIRTQIFRPLLQVHDEVLRLMEDRPILPHDRSSHSGEIRSLFDAIEALQGKWQERAVATDELRVQAETDGLTALFNRRTLDRLAHLPVGASRDQQGLCLILVDIDHFKRINDTWGHPTGDAVLVRTAELLRTAVGDKGVAARFGGEEFAVLVKGEDLAGAVFLARRIRLALRKLSFAAPDGTTFRITASFGAAQGVGGETGWKDLVSMADEALYRAKAEGRDRVRFTRPEEQGIENAGGPRLRAG